MTISVASIGAVADERSSSGGRAGRPAPPCPSCGERMRFDGGRQIHDVWAERFVCDACEQESFRSYGRGSV